jgi:4-amino-4-deoxy-L-arabinose transferase-like glycosyltransferase
VRRWWTPAIVFAAALALRCAIVVQLGGTALFRTPELDSIEYFTWAQQIAHGDFSWPAAPSHGPGYPFFLAALLFVSRGSMFAVHVLQAVAGSVTAVIIAWIARRIAGEKAGLAAGLFAALYGPLALIDVSILAEGLFVLLLSASLLAVIESMQSARPRAMLFFAGTALGLAIIVRPTAAILIPVYAYFVWRRASRAAFLVFAIAVAYPVLPVLAHNWLATGDMLAIQSGGGMNFYIGNSPRHDGTAWARPGGTWDWLRGEAWRAGIRGAAREDQYYVGKTFAEMRAAPGQFLALVARKLIWLTQTEEIRDSHSFDFFLQRAPLLRVAIRFSVLLPFAVFGIWISRRSMPWLLIAYLVAMSIGVVALVIGLRYRMPLLPALFVFAGIGAASLFDRKNLIPFAITFVVVFALTHLWRHAPTHELAEEWAMEGIALGKEHRVADALSAFGRANELDPRLGIGWTGRGDIELPLGKLIEAERAYVQSIRVDPRNARAYAHLALVRAAQNNRTGAIALLRQAIAIRPEEEALYNLSGFLFASGDLDGSETVLRDMLSLNPNDGEAMSGLARIAEMRRQRH